MRANGGVGVSVSNSGSSGSIKECVVSDGQGESGIKVFNRACVELADCEVKRNRGCGISAGGDGTRLVVSDCRICDQFGEVSCRECPYLLYP